MQKRVDITIENQIAHVRMVRSDKMNALDNDMMKAMIAAGERLKMRPDCVRSFYRVRGALFVLALIWAISVPQQTKRAMQRKLRANRLPNAHTAKPICRKRLPVFGAKSGCPL